MRRTARGKRVHMLVAYALRLDGTVRARVNGSGTAEVELMRRCNQLVDSFQSLGP